MVEIINDHNGSSNFIICEESEIFGVDTKSPSSDNLICGNCLDAKCLHLFIFSTSQSHSFTINPTFYGDDPSLWIWAPVLQWMSFEPPQLGTIPILVYIWRSFTPQSQNLSRKIFGASYLRQGSFLNMKKMKKIFIF